MSLSQICTKSLGVSFCSVSSRLQKCFWEGNKGVLLHFQEIGGDMRLSIRDCVIQSREFAGWKGTGNFKVCHRTSKTCRLPLRVGKTNEYQDDFKNDGLALATREWTHWSSLSTHCLSLLQVLHRNDTFSLLSTLGRRWSLEVVI